MKPASRVKFPIVLKNGSVTAKIYRTPVAGYDNYTLSYWIGGKRNRQLFSDLDKAEGQAAIARMTNGEILALSLTGQDRQMYLSAIEKTGKVGVPLDVAAREYAEARKILGHYPLVDAVRFWKSQNGTELKYRSLPEILVEFLSAKHYDTLKHRLTKFSARFHEQYPGDKKQRD